MKKLTPLCLIVLFACGNEQPPIEESSIEAIKEMEAMRFPTSLDTIELEIVAEEEELVSNLVMFDNPVSAYVSDPGNEPTNIRKTPKGEVMIKLQRVCDHELILTGIDNGWFLVKSIWGPDNDDESYEDVGGYIHGSILAVDTRNYGNQTLYLFAEANEDSEKRMTFKEQISFTLLTVTKDGVWAKVKSRSGVVAWIQTHWLCGSTVTLCS